MGKQALVRNPCSSSRKDSKFFVKVKITKIIISELLNSRIFRNSARYPKREHAEIVLFETLIPALTKVNKNKLYKMSLKVVLIFV